MARLVEKCVGYPRQIEVLNREKPNLKFFEFMMGISSSTAMP